MWRMSRSCALLLAAGLVATLPLPAGEVGRPAEPMHPLPAPDSGLFGDSLLPESVLEEIGVPTAPIDVLVSAPGDTP